MKAKLSVMVLLGVCAICAYAASLDIHEDFEDASLPSGKWRRSEESLSKFASYADGQYLSVDEEGALISRLLNGGSSIGLDEDVVVDAKILFTAAESPDLPKLPEKAKFALWLCGGDGSTNLYVTAGAVPIINKVCTPANYRIAADGVDVSSGGWHRVTVRAIRDIGPNMMGFVIFIDGIMAVCDEGDYLLKFPAFGDATPLVRYLIGRRAIFPSLLSYNHIEAQRLASVDFAGVGGVDDLSVADASVDAPGFAKLGDYFAIGWSAGVVGFEYRIGERGDIVPVDVADHPDSKSVVFEIGGGDRVFVSNITYDDARGYYGASTMEFAVESGAGTIVADQYNFKAGATVCTTLAEACAAVGDGGVVTLLRDVCETWPASQTSIEVSHPFTLDLAGRTLCISNNNMAVFFVKSADMSLVTSEVGGRVVVAGVTRSLFAFDPTAVHSANIGAFGCDEGVAVAGPLVSGAKSNLAIVRGTFTDSSVAELYGNVAMPRGVAPGYQARYNKLFRFTVSDVGGTYLVAAELDRESEGVKGVVGSITEATREMDVASLAAGATGVKVALDAEPGLYYGVSSGESIESMAVDEWTLATGERVELEVPGGRTGEGAGFYKVEASETTPLAR